MLRCRALGMTKVSEGVMRVLNSSVRREQPLASSFCLKQSVEKDIEYQHKEIIKSQQARQSSCLLTFSVIRLGLVIVSLKRFHQACD